MAYRHLRLQHLESRLVFAARMVGTCPSDARPSVVVTCQEVDFKRIRNLFRSRAEGPLCLGKPPRSRFPFGQRLASDEPTDPRLGLVYYRTKTPTVIRSALDKPLLAQLRNGISCGGVVRFGERTATLGVALEFGNHRAILTVDHLIPPQETQMPASSTLKGEAHPPAGSGSPLPWEPNASESVGSWDDDDEYGELDPDEAPDPMYLDFGIDPADSFGPAAHSWSAQSDGTPWTEGEPEEWNVLASSAQLEPSAEYLDWALIWPESDAQSISLSRLNTIFPKGSGSEGVVLEAFQEHILTTVAAVYIVSGLRGILHGQILAVPSYLPSAPGQESCRAWTVILNAVHGPIMSGECGSVVVDQETNKVYGHVVGNDPLGHAYVATLSITPLNSDLGRPILTYQRQGCTKRGVKPQKHGIIYQDGKSPRMLPGEPQLGFDPVRVILRERTEQLVKESRVNYAKLQTVEHNFRVYFIGRVDPEDFRKIVIPAVDRCWGSKWGDNS
ncbi:hypothetical protein NEMBOFW57_010360 [Staphylotrichum longicolle]|uniref:DUF6590 domain-containing protein n=1 Tax=Staphylotrichum longicolle TaxID=669026 RepID=A0AAD4ERD2_9PEZI|nr:hypothetical protein NEMBOFW57_010360 [Staphylotrichum longicolle]